MAEARGQDTVFGRRKRQDNDIDAGAEAFRHPNLPFETGAMSESTYATTAANTPSAGGQDAAALAAAAQADDISGRRRMARNVAFAWGGHLIHVAAGFIMPRLISDGLGQTTLGVWDFCWSIVSYFGLVQLGLSSSVQRYVPRYRARGDALGLSRSVSTIGFFLTMAGWLVVVLAAVTAQWIVPLFQAKLGQAQADTQWTVFILGLYTAFSLMFTVYRGVIVGCHRWDIQNSITAATYGATTLGMIVALALGTGLPGLALTYGLVSAAAEVVRRQFARRICPELVVDYRMASWRTWLEQARFSAKSLIPRIADLLSGQSLSLLITGFLGPAALAIYSRPKSLVSQFHSLAARYGFILIPTASSLQAQGDLGELRQTLARTTFFLSCLFFPGVVVLAVFGDNLIELWMGQSYVFPGLVTVLVLGSLPSCVQEPTWNILTGLNQHGKVALARLAGAGCSALTMAVGLALFGWGLLEAALAFALPQIIVDGLVTPFMACRRVGLPVPTFYAEAFLKPALAVLPWAASLIGARLLWAQHPAFAAGCAGFGGLSMALLYWQWVVPSLWKRRFCRWFSSRTSVGLNTVI